MLKLEILHTKFPIKYEHILKLEEITHYIEMEHAHNHKLHREEEVKINFKVIETIKMHQAQSIDLYFQNHHVTYP